MNTFHQDGLLARRDPEIQTGRSDRKLISPNSEGKKKDGSGLLPTLKEHSHRRQKGETGEANEKKHKTEAFLPELFVGQTRLLLYVAVCSSSSKLGPV